MRGHNYIQGTLEGGRTAGDIVLETLNLYTNTQVVSSIYMGWLV
jgi:hypothetical protein